MFKNIYEGTLKFSWLRRNFVTFNVKFDVLVFLSKMSLRGIKHKTMHFVSSGWLVYETLDPWAWPASDRCHWAQLDVYLYVLCTVLCRYCTVRMYCYLFSSASVGAAQLVLWWLINCVKWLSVSQRNTFYKVRGTKIVSCLSWPTTFRRQNKKI